MKALITAAAFMVMATTANAGWIATPNFEKEVCEAHPESRELEFGVLVMPAGDKVALLTVFGKGTPANTPAYIEFGPHTFGPFPVAHFQLWGSRVIMGALSKAEDEGMSIRVQRGEDSSWFVMQGFKDAVKECINLMMSSPA